MDSADSWCEHSSRHDETINILPSPNSLYIKKYYVPKYLQYKVKRCYEEGHKIWISQPKFSADLRFRLQLQRGSDRWQWKTKSLKFPKIPAKLCLNGRLWTQFGRNIFRNFPEFREKTISRGDRGQHRPENFSSRCWIRRGAISCSPHTSFDEINDSVVNSERGELVRGSDPPLV